MCNASTVIGGKDEMIRQLEAKVESLEQLAQTYNTSSGVIAEQKNQIESLRSSKDVVQMIRQVRQNLHCNLQTQLRTLK